MNFEYSHVSVAQKLTELRIFCCQGYSRVNLEKSKFLTDSFFDQLIFCQLIYVTTDFLTTLIFNSLANYLLINLGYETLDLWSCLTKIFYEYILSLSVISTIKFSQYFIISGKYSIFFNCTWICKEFRKIFTVHLILCLLHTLQESIINTMSN